MGESYPRAKALIVSIFLANGIGCGSWQRVGSDINPDPGVLIPELFNRSLVYSRMGLITQDAPFPFVASINFLAGADQSTSVGAFSMSLENTALSFRRREGRWEARYGVELTFRNQLGRVVTELVDSQTVTVETLRETMRGGETVIYQRFFALPSGTLSMNLKVRELGANIVSVWNQNFEVPDFDQDQSLSSLVPVYGVDVLRSSRELFPGMLLNPRATIRYGQDTLKLYIETYDSENRSLEIRAISAENDRLVWQDTVDFETTGAMSSAVVPVPPDSLPVGELRFEASPVGAVDTVKTSVLVSFSDQWALSNFDDILSLLRYFATRGALNDLRDAPLQQRPAAWERFWRLSDPDPSTPQNEALEDYFFRVQEANRQFRERGKPGWLTDRGEVFLTVGPPEETFEPFPDPGSPVRIIQWVYTHLRVTLNFVDQTGFDEFRLSEESRDAMFRVLPRSRGGR
jgi:GWxTD domain-containing protein